MGLFRKTTEITKLLEQFARGQNDLDAAEFVQLNELIQEKGQSGIGEAAKTLKSLLKDSDLSVQSRAIDLIRLLLDNGGANLQGILAEEFGLSERILHLANKGESRPRAKARDFLRSRATNPRLAELSTQLSPTSSPKSEDNTVVRESTSYNLSEYRHEHHLGREPGNLEGLLPFKHKTAHFQHLEEHEIDSVPKLIGVGNSLADQLENASEHSKISEVLLDNSQLVRNKVINTIHREGNNLPDALFKLNDRLQVSIPHAANFIQ